MKINSVISKRKILGALTENKNPGAYRTYKFGEEVHIYFRETEGMGGISESQYKLQMEQNK